MSTTFCGILGRFSGRNANVTMRNELMFMWRLGVDIGVQVDWLTSQNGSCLWYRTEIYGDREMGVMKYR